MARIPRRQVAVPTALQGGRPQRGVVRRLLQSAAALGGVAIDLLSRLPLRRIWRWILARFGRRPCVAARMAQKTWRDDKPARGSLLRRAVTRARGAIHAILVPGSRALAFLRDLPQRVLAFVVDLLQRLLPNFLRRQPHPRQPRPRRRPDTPPTPQKKTDGSWRFIPQRLRRLLPRRRGPRLPTPPPPAPPLIIGGWIVTEEERRQFVDYCQRASTCHPNNIICHLCIFEGRRSPNFTVPTASIILHCIECHACDGPYVRCGQAGCNIRARPGRDLELHRHFCH